MFDTTVIRKIKRPEGIGRWPAYVVNEDQYGRWLFSPKGTIYRGQSGEESSECEVGQGSGPAGIPVLHLIPDREWWVAAWFDEPASWIAVDICIPARFRDEEWCYVDLELDPFAHADGTVGLHDEDEFATAWRSGVISDAEATEARAAARTIDEALRSRAEPFGRLGWDRLEWARDLSLPPITMLAHVSTA